MPKPPSVPAGQTTSPPSRKLASLPWQSLSILTSSDHVDVLVPVTNLESVVIQLQESCTEAKSQSTELRKENARLKNEAREREKFWRALWAQRKGHDPHPDDFSQMSYPSPSLSTNQSQPLASPISPSHVSQYPDQNMSHRYSAARDANGQMGGGGMHYPAQPQHDYSSRSPSITSYAGPETMDTRGSPIHTQQRLPKYGPYPSYDVEGNVRDPSWTQGMNQSSIAHADPMNPGSTTPTHSPAFIEGSASNLTSPEIPYLPRYVEDQKMGLPNLDTSTPYTFAPNRPLSPTASTTSSSSSTMTSPFQFPFPGDPVSNDRPDFNSFRRHSTNGGAELTLHGGTAHISVVSNDERYRMAAPRRPTNVPDQQQSFPIIPPFSNNNNNNNTETTSPDRDNSEAEPYHYNSHNISRRATNSRSRSPSPSGPPICSTLAVIKAQAFGALRRTRTRQKKGSEGAAKAAMEALEARGIGIGMNKSNKRPRLDDDEDDAEYRP